MRKPELFYIGHVEQPGHTVGMGWRVLPTPLVRGVTAVRMGPAATPARPKPRGWGST